MGHTLIFNVKVLHISVVIEVRPDTGDDVYSSSFRSKMELRLAEAYNLAMWIRSNSKRSRRAATLGDATIQVIVMEICWSPRR